MGSAEALREKLREASRRLTGIEAGNPMLEAQYLLCRALGCDRVTLLGWGDQEPVPGESLLRFEALLQERLRRTPLQYVLGTAQFCGLELEVGPGVLIPRSETEGLVERAAQAAVSAVSAGGPGPNAPLLIDIGTGSGAILLSLLVRLPGWVGVGIDRSREALSWASRNRARYSPDRAWLARGDLLRGIRAGCASLVVSNPPYVRTGDLSLLAPEIREHEPREALDGGEDGLDSVRALLPVVERTLRPGGWFFLELAPDQPERVRILLQETGAFEEVETHPDLAGRPRVVQARRSRVPASDRS